MIPPEVIESIRDRTSIARVVGDSVKLERRGRSLVGLCPFHREKTPSFHVHEDRGRYHCFGCQASGDAFKFVQETEGLTFLEAVRALGERAGVEVVDDLSQEERRKRTAARRREQGYYDVMKAAASFFERMLDEHPQREFALRELENRGLPRGGDFDEVLRAFHLGYAPDSWDALVTHLRKVGLDLRAAEAVGLIAPRKSGGGHYDRFRHRLMFAVLDLQGRVVAFSGRALPPASGNPLDEPPAKYINSPETPIYRKRETVFGLYQARQALRAGEAAVIVEGNFDVVSLHARGFPTAVAPLGTAFTLEQAKNIRRFCSDVVFLFDGDRAGKEATAKAREPSREAGLRARVARLPAGMDPDDFSRTRGADDLRNVIRASSGMLDYLIAEALDEDFVASDAEARAAKVEQVLNLLSSENDPTVRALAEQHADTLASRLGVADARTFRALRANVRKRLASPAVAGDVKKKTQPQGRPGEFEIGLHIIGALLDFPELLDTEEFLAYANDMEGDVAAAVACLRRAREQAGGDLPRVTEAVDDHEQYSPPHTNSEANRREGLDLNQVLAKMPRDVRPFVEARVAAPLHGQVETASGELFANLRKLQQMHLSQLSASAMNELERARSEGNFEQELSLLREQEQRARRRRGIE